MTIERGQFVRITGGVSDHGKIGQVSDVGHSGWVGVRIPNIADAIETTYVTDGSVEVVVDGEITKPSKPKPYSSGCLASDIPGATCQSPNCDC